MVAKRECLWAIRLIAWSGVVILLYGDAFGRDLKGRERYHGEVVEEFEDDDYDDNAVRTGPRVKSRARRTTTPGSPGPVMPAPGSEGATVVGDPSTTGKKDTSGGTIGTTQQPSAAGQVISPKALEELPSGSKNAKDAMELLQRKMLEIQQKMGKKGKQPAAPPGPAPGSELSREMTLFMDPPVCDAEVGKRFTAQVVLNNIGGSEFDQVGFTIHYDKNILRAIDGDADQDGINVDDRSFRGEFPWESGREFQEYENRIDPSRGLITYRLMSGPDELLTTSGLIASVTFEGLQPIDSKLEFVFEDTKGAAETEDSELLTYVMLNGEDVLGSEVDLTDGVVAGDVWFPAVKEEDVLADLGALESRDLSTLISIVPEVERVPAGGEFDVHIEVDNRDRVRFDEICLYLGYNPRFLKVMDYDRGNYISRGINIFDGEYHQAFPFNLHRNNKVDPARGVVYYRMGSLQSALNGSGRAATIRFKALARTDARGTRIKVGFLKGRNGSGLFFRGKDVLANPDDSRDGFESYPVWIVSDQVSRAD